MVSTRTGSGTYFIYKLIMKYTITFLIVLFHLSAWAQPDDSFRKTKIDRCMKPVYSVKEFWRIADSMQMTIGELCDYPVIFPIKKPLRISSGFGMRYHPVYKTRRFHTGIDIPETKGTPVYSTGNGIVVQKGYCPGYGYFVEIEHAGGFRSFYAHLSKTMVNIGDTVNIASPIACVGSSGISTGSHLHYEIRKGKRYLNPIEWCGCLFAIMNKQTSNRKTA